MVRRHADLRVAGCALAVLALALARPLAADSAYTGALTGDVISPPVTTTGSGTVHFEVTASTLHVDLAFASLVAVSTGGHIHCCADLPDSAAVAVFLPGFPIGVTSGSLEVTLDLLSSATYNPSFVTSSGGTVAGARAALTTGLRDLRAYYCVHSTSYPGSELRAYADWVSFEDGFESSDVSGWSLEEGYLP